MTAERGISVGAHFILGLPGQSDEMLVAQTAAINALPLTTVKFHQLQLIRGTRMALDVEQGAYDIHRFTPESYAALCARLVRRLRPDIAVERFVSQSPPDLLIYPRWSLKNYQFTQLVNKILSVTP